MLADGFYEWKRDGDVKVPHFISLASGEPFGLAALWESWTDKESGDTLQSTTLLTQEANAFMQPGHHRMPLILESATADEWLASGSDYLEVASEKTPELRAWPVDRRVNNARNEGEDLIVADGKILG